MKKTIQKTMLGGLASLIIGSGLALGDEAKKDLPAEPQGGILPKEAKAEVLKQLKEIGLDQKFQDQLEKALQATQNGAPAVTAKTFVIGPDGKMKEIDPKDGPGLDLEALLKDGDQKGLQKLLQQQDGAVAGKIVVVGEDGKRVEKELKPGQDLNALVQEALKGADLGGIDLGGIDLNAIVGEARVLGVGPASIEGRANNRDLNSLKADLKEVREEMKAQRKLLEEILKKLD